MKRRWGVSAVVVPSREAWSEHLQSVFRELGLDSAPFCAHLSEGVATYCRTFCPRGLQTKDLKLLVARACCSIGERDAAEQVLKSIQPHARHVNRWLEILSELHNFPELLPYFSAGIIRPAEWVGAQLDRMWTVDFSRLHLAESERHEMLLHRSVRLLIERLAGVWDACSGEGVLGIKGWRAWEMEDEGSLWAYLSDLLAHEQVERGWATRPDLLDLG